jgi:hypothetical protein
VSDNSSYNRSCPHSCLLRTNILLGCTFSDTLNPHASFRITDYAVQQLRQTEYKQPTPCIELYRSFIQYTGCYMFQQQSAIIRELLGSFWVTRNTNWMGIISYNVWLCSLCAGLLWFHLLCFPAECTQLGSTTDRTTTLRHTGHVTTHCMIYHPFDLYFK